jgi:hypothetical protein
MEGNRKFSIIHKNKAGNRNYLLEGPDDKFNKDFK